MSSNTADSDLKFRPPNQFKITDRTRLEDWKKWQKSFRWYASEVNLNQRSHDVQLTTFKSLLGPEALEIYNTFSLLDIADVESVILKFDEHFKPKVNLIKERFTLYKLYQKPGQSFQKYLETVTSQVDKCEFGSMRDDIILYKIVGGLESDDVRKTLLSEVDLNCEKAVKICQASAQSNLQNVTNCGSRLSKTIKTAKPIAKKLRCSKEAKSGESSTTPSKALVKESIGSGNEEVIGKCTPRVVLKTLTERSKGSTRKLRSHRGLKLLALAAKSRLAEREDKKEDETSSDIRAQTAVLNLDENDGNHGVVLRPNDVEVPNKPLTGVQNPSGVEQNNSNLNVGNEPPKHGVDGKQWPLDIAIKTLDEDGSSDGGGDDWRDTDYQVDDDDDGEDEPVTARLSKKKSDYMNGERFVSESDKKPKKKEEYPCDLCGKVLASKSGRFVHRKNHLEGKFYSCYYCGPKTKFKQRMYLRRHMHKIHADLLGTKPKYFTCDECGYKTVISSNMKRHKYKHSVEKPLNCELCDYKCIVGRQMQMHMSTKHVDQSEKEPVTCTQCSMKFKLQSALKVHMLSHLPPEEREQRRSEMMKNSVFTHPCDVCGKVFTSMTGLKSHLYTHTGEKPFACEHCGYKAVQKSSLNTHIKLKHSEETPFICSVCGYACKLQSTLKTHMTVHTGERPYACDQCSSRFKQHAHLITHKKTHTGEKPYVCDICGHRWAQEGNLRAHMKIHRNQSGDPSQFSPPRKRKKKTKNDQAQPAPVEAAVDAEEPVPPSTIPQWSEQVTTINPMECFQTMEAPPPFQPPYQIVPGNPRPPAADCRFFQQRQWPTQNPVPNHNSIPNPNIAQNPVHSHVPNQHPHLISLGLRPTATVRAELQHPHV